MAAFTSKELYMMNGGQKLYIWKDGFGDVYNATAAEEAAWAKEIVEQALVKIATETNATMLQFTIADLVYHKYEGAETLLLKAIENTSPSRQIVFANALWRMAAYDKSFDIIYDILLQHRAEVLNEVFYGLNELKDNAKAQQFLIHCLQGEDKELVGKAQNTIAIWSWNGLPALRENGLAEQLGLEHKGTEKFRQAIDKLKQIFQTKS